MNNFLAAVVAVGVCAIAVGVWGIYAVLRLGINEHIKALQAIYENTRHLRPGEHSR